MNLCEFSNLRSLIQMNFWRVNFKSDAKWTFMQVNQRSLAKNWFRSKWTNVGLKWIYGVKRQTSSRMNFYISEFETKYVNEWTLERNVSAMSIIFSLKWISKELPKWTKASFKWILSELKCQRSEFALEASCKMNFYANKLKMNLFMSEL